MKQNKKQDEKQKKVQNKKQEQALSKEQEEERKRQIQQRKEQEKIDLLRRMEEFDFQDYIDEKCLLKESTTEDEDYRKKEDYDELKKIGIVYHGNTPYFDPNIFGMYMYEALIAVRDNSGNIFLYNRSRGVYVEAEEWMLKIICKQLMNQLKNTWSLSRERSGIESFKREVTIIIKDFRFPDYINLKNYIIDLQTWQSKKHSPKYFMLTQLEVEYQKDAKCPRFKQFIKEITGGDKQLITVLQEVMGYCLCQNTRAEKAFFFYGGGKNGKSVLSEVMKKLVGQSNASNVSLNDMSGNFGIEPMRNKTLNVASENYVSGKFHPDHLKEIVSGDSVNVNIKFQNSVSYAMFCKLVFLVNTLPDVSDFSYGFFRKIMIIPFKVTIEDPDVFLNKKLEEELPGILKWALAGLHRLVKNNYQFSQCDAIDACTKDYQDKQNPTGKFFLETYKATPGARIRKPEIFQEYSEWAKCAGIDPGVPQTFWKMLENKAAEPNSQIELHYKKSGNDHYLLNYSRINPKEEVEVTYELVEKK